MYEFVDCVQKMAIGTECTMEEIVHRFSKGLHDSKLADVEVQTEEMIFLVFIYMFLI